MGDQVEIVAAWIGIGGVVLAALLSFAIGRHFAGQQEKHQDVSIEMELRGLLQEQADSLDAARDRLALCEERHIEDGRRLLACENDIISLREINQQQDFVIRALRYDIDQLRSGH